MFPAGGLFVTGTDTGVGKTVVTAALVHALRARGVYAGVVKPVQTGNLAADPDGDAALLVSLGGLDAAPEDINAYAFAPPLAPRIAADQEDVTIELAPMVDLVQSIRDENGTVLVEGAGGWLVPLAPGLLVADLAVALGYPVVVVGRIGLGTVNHTALTVAAVLERGLDVAGVILNGYGQGADGSVASNPRLIEELTGVPVIGKTPWRSGDITAERLRTEVAPTIDVGPLLAALSP
jgi:dethiobiotin synthetase